MFAANDVTTYLAIVGEDEKGVHDYTLAEMHHLVIQAVNQTMSERSFRRILQGLGISKNDNGYYAPPDAILVIGWIKNRHKYSSYKEYKDRDGRRIHQKAKEVNFNGC